MTVITAALRPVTTMGSSNPVINQTSLLNTTGYYHFNISDLRFTPAEVLQPEQAMAPVKQAGASSIGATQLSQLDQILAPAPSPAPAGTADAGPHPATGQQQNHPNSQAVSFPEPDNHGSAAPTHVLPDSSTYFVPQITTQLAPVVAGKPLVDVGGGKFQVNGQTFSPGGATAIIEGTLVFVNPQGAPVVGTQTYPPGPAATTSIIGEAPATPWRHLAL